MNPFCLTRPVAAIVLALSTGFGATAAMAEAWGSISVDFPGEGVSMASPAYGVGGGATKEEAIANAQKFCAESGGKVCKTAISYETCGAYAASSKHGGVGMAATKKLAQANAIAACNEDACKIVIADCN